MTSLNIYGYTKTTKRYLLVVLSCLIFGHLVIQLFFPNVLINVAGFLVLFYLIYIKALKADYFVFALSIYSLSYFQYALAQGGIFNLLTFCAITLHIFSKKDYYILKNPNKIVNILLLILIVSHFLGITLKSNTSIDSKLLGTLSLFGYILMFNFISYLRLSPDRIKLFIFGTSLMLGYSLLISINKFFMFFNSNSPMLGGGGRFGSRNLAGTLGQSPIYGELGLLVFTFLLPFIFSKLTQTVFRIKLRNIVIPVLFALLTILMAASRSAIILAAISFCLIFLIGNFSISQFRNRIIINLMVISIIIIAFSLIAPLLNLGYVKERFSLIDPFEINVETVISGESINRSTAFKVGKEILNRESWHLGYGWGTVRGNRIAWFGDENYFRSDPHSLYYSLPMLFGWIGSAAFILIFFRIIYQLLKLCFFYKRALKESYIPCLGLAFLLMFFLINEYKITALSSPHYFMIIWILLGMANSYVNQFRTKYRNNNVQNS